MLQRQNITMPLAEGVDTKTDQKQVVAGKLLELENGTFTTLKTITKRNGSIAFGQSILNESGTKISTGVGLATYGSELLLANGQTMFSYDQSSDAWARKGLYLPARVEQFPVVTDANSQTVPDGATAESGLQAYAWEDSQTPGTIRYCIIDGQTQQTLLASTLLATGSKPRVLATDSHFLIYFYAAVPYSALYLAQIPFANPTIAPSITAITSVATGLASTISATAPNYDAALFSSTSSKTQSRIYLVFNNDTGSETTLRVYLASSPTLVAVETTIGYASRAVTVFRTKTLSLNYGPVVVLANDNGSAPFTTSIEYAAFSPSLVPQASGTLVSNLEYQQARAITGSSTTGTSIGFTVFYSNCDTQPISTSKVTVGDAYNVGTPSLLKRGVTPVGKAFNYGGNCYVPVVYFYPGNVTAPDGDTPSQSAYFLMDKDANLVAKAFSDQNGSPAYNAQFASTPATLGKIGNINLVTGVITLTTASDTANFTVGMALQARSNGVIATLPSVVYVVSIGSGTVTVADGPSNPGGSGLAFWKGGIGYTLSALTASMLNAPLLASAALVNDTTWRYALTNQVLIQGSLTQTQSNVSAVTFDLAAPKFAVNHAELATNLHLTGGFVQMYDGASIVEHGFHVYPILTIDSVDASGGELSAGTYHYTACYEWIDNQGNIHQSAPALYKTTVTTGANSRVSIKVNYLNLTAKTGNHPVQIVIYRTEADLKLFYRVSSLTDASLNNVNGDYLYFTDTMSNSVLSKRPQLYCQPLQADAGIASVVENTCAPPTGLIALHRNRLWIVPSTDPLTIWYSKNIGASTPVAFNDGFVKQVDPRGGPITALATVDDKLLVFKGDRIFFIVGQGPDDNGLNNDLSDSILITTDCGCIDPRSVVGTPVGIMFQSRKGIYLIDRSLQVQYIGAPVEAYNNEVITSAALLARTNQVRFTLESGKTLLYDYLVNQWGTFTNQYAVDSIIWQGDYLIMRGNGKVLRETPGVYLDDGVPYSLKIATSWLSFANIQGFQRVRRMLVLGGQEAPGQLQVSVCVDFDDTIVQQALVTPAQPQTFGSVTPYGGGLYGGTFQLYQWRVDLARQKTQAVKFVIEDLPSVTATALNLTSLAFEVGAKQGLNKVPASQTVS